METLRYIDNVVTIAVDQEKCVGCSMCVIVCPHNVFRVENKKAEFQDRDGCMECGACSKNCPVQAISVSPGVGCASLIINRWLKGSRFSAGGCC